MTTGHDTVMTDRVLAILQARFPMHFELAVLTAQNEQLAAALDAADTEGNTEDATAS